MQEQILIYKDTENRELDLVQYTDDIKKCSIDGILESFTKQKEKNNHNNSDNTGEPPKKKRKMYIFIYARVLCVLFCLCNNGLLNNFFHITCWWWS